MEHKYVNFELESKDIGQDGQFSGYASVFDTVDQGGDIVASGALDSVLVPGARMPKMLWQHDATKVCGVWDRFQKDSHGLKGYGRLLVETQYGKEAHVLMRAGAIDGLSIGYKTEEVEWIETAKGAVRKILKAALWEVSVVTFPMNLESVVTDVKQLQGPREVEQLLRKAGVPGTFAKLVALYGFDEAKFRLSNDQREADDKGKRAQLGFDLLLKEIQSLKETING